MNKMESKNLQNATKLKQYKTCLYKLNEKGMQQDIAKEWAHIKQTII
jgi:hypothetical protein